MTVQLRPGRLLRVTPHGGGVIGSRRFWTFDAWGAIHVHGIAYGVGFDGYVDKSDQPELLVSMGRATSRHGKFAFQDHEYDVVLPAGAVTISRNLSHVRIDTGDTLGSWGRIRMTFHPAGDRIVRCGGKTVRRRGTTDGSFSFTPQNDNGFFGTITRARFKHAEVFMRDGCGQGGGGHHHPCTVQRFYADADIERRSSFVSFFGTSLGPAYPESESVVYQQWPDNVNVFHFIDEDVPNGSVHLVNGRSVQIGAPSHGFISGSARFTSKGRPQFQGLPCGHHQSSEYVTWDGHMAAKAGAPLTGLFDTGDVGLPPLHPVPGFLTRIHVH